MSDTFDNLRDALLLTLVVMLIYVLYKRLLRVLGKDDVSTPRFEIIQGSEIVNDQGFECRISVPFSTVISASIQTQLNGQELNEVVFEREFEPGEHTVILVFDRNPIISSLGVELRSHNRKIIRRLN
ncbi:MAG: hypothetical protein ACFCUH_02615 [Flavobacteriales bacterium]